MVALLMVAGEGTPALTQGPGDGPGRPDVRVGFQGQVVHVELEGGFWGLVSKDGRQFEPVGLPPQFQQDGLQVEVTAVILRDTASIRMWGQVIRILDIREAPPPKP